jgi:hypothetical protein
MMKDQLLILANLTLFDRLKIVCVILNSVKSHERRLLIGRDLRKQAFDWLLPRVKSA